jgi:hypothetical protein
MTGSPLDPLVHLLTSLAITVGAAAVATVSLVSFLRWLDLHWSWALPGVLLGPLLWSFDQQAAGFVAATAVFATVTGARWHRDDLKVGADQAQIARDRRTPLDAARERMQRRGVRGGRWMDRQGLAVGRDERGRTVRIPVGHTSGRHALVVGATGSGKTRHAGMDCRTPHPKRARRGRHRPQGRPAPARRARARRPQGAPDVPGVDAGRPGGLQPVRARHRHGARRQGPRRRDVHRAALPAPGAALPRARRPLPARLGTAGDGGDAGRRDGPRQARVLSAARCPTSKPSRSTTTSTHSPPSRNEAWPAHGTGSRSSPSRTS